MSPPKMEKLTQPLGVFGSSASEALREQTVSPGSWNSVTTTQDSGRGWNTGGWSLTSSIVTLQNCYQYYKLLYQKMHCVSHRVESRKTTHKHCFRNKDAAAINEEQDKNTVVRSSLPSLGFLSLVKSVKLIFTNVSKQKPLLTKLFKCSQKVKICTNDC